MPSLASAFVENFRVGIDIIRCSRPFSWFLWSSSFGAVKDSLPKKKHPHHRPADGVFYPNHY
jgi:hypothetical protein